MTGTPAPEEAIHRPQEAEMRHVLSLSGGKDSAALAVYMRDRVPEMEYVFHDTDKELPETYDYLDRLAAILGKPIAKTSPVDTFDHWLVVYGGMLPSNHRRWCTKMLKLKPFENFVGDSPVINYVGLRADENRVGYISTKTQHNGRLPLSGGRSGARRHHSHSRGFRVGYAAIHGMGPVPIGVLLLLLSTEDRVGAAERKAP